MSEQGALPTAGGYAGPAWQLTGGKEFSALDFMIRQVIAGKAFAGLVKVISVTGGGVASPPRVSVQPMVNQIDGFGNQTPHGTIYDLPVFRLQGGANAMILDPIEGDIGEAICCDRDISNVKATGKIAGPGTWRQNDWADGCYFGSFLGAAPTQYGWLSDAGIAFVSPVQISLTVGGFGIVITASGTTIDGKPFLPHRHGLTGGGDTEGVA